MTQSGGRTRGRNGEGHGRPEIRISDQPSEGMRTGSLPYLATQTVGLNESLTVNVSESRILKVVVRQSRNNRQWACGTPWTWLTQQALKATTHCRLNNLLPFPCPNQMLAEGQYYADAIYHAIYHAVSK